MPSLNFVLPLWLYWGGLAIFPLVAMYLVAKQRRRGPPHEPILFSAYLFWLTAGFAGIHRFYLKSWWGFAFVPFLIAVVYCNAQVREVRDDVSRTFAALEQAQTDLRGARSDLERAQPGGMDNAAVAKAQAEVTAREADYSGAEAVHNHWFGLSRDAALAIALLLLIDAFLIPGLVRRRRAREKPVAPVEVHSPVVHEQGTGEDPTLGFHTRFTDAIEKVNVKTGEYVAY
jgi:hypothetical protein